MLRKALLSLLLSTAFVQSFSQTGSISGHVKSNGQPIATITLLKAADSSWVRSDMTDEKGIFQMKDVTTGKYLVIGNALGYKTTSVAAEVTADETFNCELSMEEDSKSLGEVAITAKKPFIEMSLGKMTVNIDGSTTTGVTNVLDLMKRLPGVTVSQDGIISMHSKAGVLVLVDDRQTYLEGADLADYLRGIPADDVSQLELVTQPDARYDAAGNTGIINVKLKRNRKQGWSGSVTAGYGQGIYFHRNEGAQVNYRKNKLNVSMNVTDMEAIGFADWRQHFTFLDSAGNPNGTKSVQSFAKERFGNQAAQMGIDYDINSKTSIGLHSGGNYHPNTMNFDISTVTNDTAHGRMLASEKGTLRKDLTTNFYLTYKFSDNSKMNVNIDHLYYMKSAGELIYNYNYDSHMLPLDSSQQSIDRPKARNVYSIRADYSTAISKMKLESGLKSSFVSSDINVTYLDYIDNQWISNANWSNHFLYKENINALYAIVSGTISKTIEFRGGLRGEHTYSDGLQYVNNQHFTRSYLSLFPTAFISWKKDSNNIFELNYGRRIDRPSYNDLNPFVALNFQNNYETGNPELKPEFTHNVELKHSYKNILITTISGSSTTDAFQGLLTADSKTKLTYYTTSNVASNKNLVLSLAFNKDLFRWWSFSISGVAFYATFSGVYDGIYLSKDWGGGSVDFSSRFDMGKGWKAEVYANYVSPGRWGLASTFDQWVSFDFGCSKKINDHFSAKFFAYDPLSIFGFHSYVHDYNYRMDVRHRMATQLFSLSLTYSFGSGQAKEQKEHIVDEAKRM